MTNTIHVGILDSLYQASLVVQFILLILIGLSVCCWSIAWAKRRQFQQVKSANKLFLDKFYSATSLDHIFDDIDQFPKSSAAKSFAAGYEELKKISDSSKSQHLSGIENIERTLRQTTDNEISSLESKLTLLATTGSTGPFIGLFGTVWGIMSSFQKIGQMGSASLAVVAPGIAEALVATAVGLAAAIPAVIFYNRFIAQIRKSEIEMGQFNTDFLNIVKRNFFQSASN